MRMLEIVNRPCPPVPWQEGDNIPWNDPDFSRRMLKEHLSQSHDAASRRFAIVDGHVAWIHANLLQGSPSRVLDLGCGPGLYTTRLARLGHRCEGIDYSPASVTYANETAEKETLAAFHLLGDIRTTTFGHSFDLVMMLYGEFHVFHPDTARSILQRAHKALRQGGRLLLEPHTVEGVKAYGTEPRSWSARPSGLFSDQPHLYLCEGFWHEDVQASTVRHWVIDAASGETQRWSGTYTAYTREQFTAMLSEAGFTDIQFLGGIGDHRQEGFQAITAVAG